MYIKQQKKVRKIERQKEIIIISTVIVQGKITYMLINVVE